MIKLFSNQIIFILLTLHLAWLSVSHAAEINEINMQVGETRVLPHPKITRIAVGNRQIISAVNAQDSEVLIFARQEGLSSLNIWTREGKQTAYTINVMAAGTQRMQGELNELLARIPGVRSKNVGNKIIIEGQNLADSDRTRIAALVERYPQILDFTSQMGWDRMIMLDVQVLELPRSQMQELGVRWDAATKGGLHAGLTWGSAQALGIVEQSNDNKQEGAAKNFLRRAYFGVDASLSARVDALAQSGQAVILAQPQLLARSGATAEFLAGGEVPYATVDADGKATTIFKPYGVSLRITPHAESNDAIRARIEVEASSVDSSVSAPGGPALKTRRAATEFNVRSGQTLVLAGFVSREKSENQNGLPMLANIPLLGTLFRSTRHERKETELAIFVTPTIVSQDHPGLNERIRRGQAVLENTFTEPALLNVPITSSSGQGSSGWNPYFGAGSQW